MPEITLTVKHEVGLHARPAALFVQTAKRFNGDIRVTHGEKLGVDQGAMITIHAEGEDADQALAALDALVENNFREKE